MQCSIKRRIVQLAQVRLRERIALGTTSGPKWAFSFVICLISASWPAHNQPTHLLCSQYPPIYRAPGGKNTICRRCGDNLPKREWALLVPNMIRSRPSTLRSSPFAV